LNRNRCVLDSWIFQQACSLEQDVGVGSKRPRHSISNKPTQDCSGGQQKKPNVQDRIHPDQDRQIELSTAANQDKLGDQSNPPHQAPRKQQPPELLAEIRARAHISQQRPTPHAQQQPAQQKGQSSPRGHRRGCFGQSSGNSCLGRGHRCDNTAQKPSVRDPPSRTNDSTPSGPRETGIQTQMYLTLMFCLQKICMPIQKLQKKLNNNQLLLINLY